MPSIKIDPAVLTELQQSNMIEEYLQGSGKSPGSPFHVAVDGAVTWGDSLMTAPPPPPEPEPEPEPAPEPTPDYTKMTKEKIEQHVLMHHGINLDTRMKKAAMIAKAKELDS